MLVLTRKQDEAIVIDGQITIRVLQLRGNRIRLGIEAPQDVVIRRGELALLLADSGPASGGRQPAATCSSHG